MPDHDCTPNADRLYAGGLAGPTLYSGKIGRPGTTVIYIFERETEALRIETRYSKDSLLYEIIWRRADGTTTRETFAGETSFRSRLDEIYGQLEGEEWRHIGPPQLLAGGWKI